MDSFNLQSWLARLRPMRLIPGNSKHERALCAYSACFQMIVNRCANTTESHINSTAGAADPNACSYTLDWISNHNKHAGNNKDQIHTWPARVDSRVIIISTEELETLIQVEVKWAVATAQREELRRMSRNMIKEIPCDVFTTEFCDATDSINDFSPCRLWRA